MFGQVEATPTPWEEEGWRAIRHYAYVERPFDDLWPLLATEPNGVLGEGASVPLGSGTSDLHAHLGGVDVARTVAMHFSGLVCDDAWAGLAMHWEAAHHPRMFPVLEATLELVPVPSGRRHFTQVGLVGRYRPPLGVLGDMADRLGGSGVAVESIRHFVEDLARRLESMVTPQPPEPGEEEPTPDVDREPDGPEVKKVLLIVERLASRLGGAVGVARRLAATPGVVRVAIHPDTTLAEIHYDPARCHPGDLLDDLDDDDAFTIAGTASGSGSGA
ncbi:MAG TPA: hypothetical protein VGJ86_20470 [Acidimicrobiales bacterium]